MPNSTEIDDMYPALPQNWMQFKRDIKNSFFFKLPNNNSKLGLIVAGVSRVIAWLGGIFCVTGIVVTSKIVEKYTFLRFDEEVLAFVFCVMFVAFYEWISRGIFDTDYYIDRKKIDLTINFERSISVGRQINQLEHGISRVLMVHSDRFSSVLKRLFDLIVAFSAIVLLLPLMLAISICIKRESAGPLIFRQQRTGLGGRPFYMYKFRTMYILADDTKTFGVYDYQDSRISGIGRFLRATNLDELPQLFNVIEGEMSIVGPRPHAPEHDVYYSDKIENYNIRYSVKPGLTGWAQVNGLVGELPLVTSMLERHKYDIWYAQNWSPILDLTILFKTIWIMFSAKNT